LTRILLKDINIPATTAMETIYPEGRIIALNSGANVIMPNMTIEKYRENYEIYPNKNNAYATKTEIEQMLTSIGRCVSQTQGFRKK
ncbi:[bacterium]|nr:[FeFe] hydrogenase H-cluster radical SAM maturase HydE [bacterium]